MKNIGRVQGLYLIGTLLLLSSQVIASTNTGSTKMKNTMDLKVEATDAVDSALTVLEDLKQANSESQTSADQLDASQQAECSESIAHLQDVILQNRDVAEEATSHRDIIDQQIDDTSDYLNWIKNRVDAINKKRESLDEQRCVSNAFFIRALKQHSEAMEVIDELKKDLVPYASESPKQEPNFTQVKSVTDKLQMYSHLFNTQAIKTLNSISQVPQSEDVDESLFDWDSEADDNNQGQLELQHAVDGSSQRIKEHSLGDKLIDLLNQLKDHLGKSIKDLTDNEISSAWDLATWLSHSEQELEHLSNEEIKKAQYFEKLKIALQSAKAHEEQSWQIHDASVSILNSYINECESKHSQYLNILSRRSNENTILDEVLQIFQSQVSTMGNDIRNKANQHINKQQEQLNPPQPQQ